MRFLVYILSVYLLVLTAIPCIDAPQTEVLTCLEGSQGASHDHEKAQDSCSPFCTCQCCASPVVFVDFVMDVCDFELITEYCSTYSMEYVSQGYGLIWQPPKLV